MECRLLLNIGANYKTYRARTSENFDVRARRRYEALQRRRIPLCKQAGEGPIFFI